ncbi:MAG TPA: S9 family peptidase [Edaphobacter sp.]|jgi:dipeptidyl aminopeptidase/acylaminoacyl peptidase|nr:S9 family peptidase [Edaphobacter sp.]
MTFADLERMKRVSDPQISPSGKWVMFSVTEVDLEKNSRVNHLWVVPMGGASGDASGSTNGSAARGGKERQITFWKEGESGGRFSPDGRQVLFISEDGGTSSQIYLSSWNEAQGTLGTPKRLTNVSTEAGGAIWSPDSQRILFTSRVYPECSQGSSWIEEDNCDKRKDAEAKANSVKAETWDHLLYRHWNSYLGPKRSHVLVVSASDGNAVRDLTPREDIGDAEAPTFSLGGPVGYAWAPDSKEIAFVTNVDLVPAASTNNDVFTLRLDTTGARPVKVSLSPGSDDAPAYSPSGKYLAFRSQARAGYESDRYRLMVLDRETMNVTELLPKYDRWVDEFVWGPDSKAVYIASADAGRTVILRYQFEGEPEYPIKPMTSDGEFSDLQISFDGNNLVATRMSVDQPGEINAISPALTEEEQPVDAGSPQAKQAAEIAKFSILGTLDVGGSSPRRQLTHLNDALLSTLDLSGQGTFRFLGAGGTPVEGFIVRPPNFDEMRKYPLKFLIHGGPQGAWGDAWSYRWNPELMAASGYVVVMVNPRGSTGYGQAFVDGVNGDWGGKAYVDLMRGLDYAEKQFPYIDKTRECALGASYGGFMANWILTHTNRFACIVTHDGMFNPQSAYGSTEELWFNEWEFREPTVAAAAKGRAAHSTLDPTPAQPWNYFDRPAAQDPFRRWSPMLAIRNAKTPTLVIHSQRDYRLDVSEGFQLFTALQRLNVPSKMLYFPDEGHWILKPQNSKLWYETVGDWCDRWTKTNAYAEGGYEAPAAPIVPRARAGSSDTRTSDTRMGVSRPAEVEEEKPTPPEKKETPPPEVERTPRRGRAPATTEPAAPPAEPPTPVAPPSPTSAKENAKEKSSPKSFANASANGDSRASFQIEISAPTDEVQVGGDARIIIALNNRSDHEILFAHRPGTNNPEFSYKIEVRNAAGHEVEETEYAREARTRQQIEGRSVDYLQPGMSSVQTAHLARLVNLSRPGRYTVRVSRVDPATHTVVKSNEITLNVVP